MANRIITAEEAARDILAIVQQQVAEMRSEGMTESQISEVFDAVFLPLAMSPH